MAFYSAEGCTLTFNGSAVSQLSSFTLPETTANVDKAAHLNSTSMDVQVSNIDDLGQFQFAYFWDHADTGQTAVRGGTGNTVHTCVLTLATGDTITITGKLSNVGGSSSDGLGRMTETATLEVTSISISEV